MKLSKIFLSLLLVASAFSSFGQYRYNEMPENGMPFVVSKENVSIAYGSTITINTQHEDNTYQVTLTGASTINLSKTNAFIGDHAHLIINATTTSRVVTWGSNVKANYSTLIVSTTLPRVVEFIYNGTYWVASNTNLSSQIRNATAYTTTSTVTATELSGGILTVTSGTLTLTLPTAINIGAQLGASAGTAFEFTVINTSGAGPVTISVNTGITASVFPSSNTLTLSPSTTTGIATFKLTFISATVATLTRTS